MVVKKPGGEDEEEQQLSRGGDSHGVWHSKSGGMDRGLSMVYVRNSQ
jgi:hypothetical protein